jgi:hypothetical protein
MSLRPDLVVFRIWKDGGGVIALFPELPADLLGRFCLSYERVGQHAAADYLGVIRQTLPACPEQYAALARELSLIGYVVRPICRASPTHHCRRREAARTGS